MNHSEQAMADCIWMETAPNAWSLAEQKGKDSLQERLEDVAYEEKVMALDKRALELDRQTLELERKRLLLTREVRGSGADGGAKRRRLW